MISENLVQDMKVAMKSGDKVKLGVIRMLLSELKNAQIAAGHELSEQEEQKVISSYAKKRKETVETYKEAGRSDLAEKEEYEYDLTISYLPPQMDEDELVNIIADSMNALFDGSAISASPGSGTEALQNDVRSAVASWFDSKDSQFSTDFGIGFDFEDNDGKVFKFSQADRGRFEDALTSPQSAAAVHQALFGIESGGLFNQIHSALTAAGTGRELQTSLNGLFLDVTI
ncbi:MAG: GatB/YqeY domain-containing protein [Candidatus Latescibacterota bacterium]|nr:MAG: GatB/YqeY domain-containing protein [Candidatus Latescibacterota bacterium]